MWTLTSSSTIRDLRIHVIGVVYRPVASFVRWTSANVGCMNSLTHVVC